MTRSVRWHATTTPRVTTLPQQIITVYLYIDARGMCLFTAIVTLEGQMYEYLNYTTEIGSCLRML